MYNIWIGLRGSDHQMFQDFAPINYVVSIDCDDTISTPFISKEFLTKERTCWSNEELLEVTKLIGFNSLLKTLKTRTDGVNIYCYHSLPILEEITKHHPHIRLHAASIKTKRKLDDKLDFFHLSQRLNLNTIPTLEITTTNSSHEELSERLGTPYVIKSRVGASGGQTYLVRNKKDFLALQPSLDNSEIVLASKYITGCSFNVNGFIGLDIHLTQPSFQLIGLPESSTHPFAYCGNDFGAFLALEPTIKKEIFSATKTIGGYMKDIGYYGIFGVDFIYNIEDKILYALEINPRMQGSTPLLTRYQMSKGAKTLAHLFSEQNISLKDEQVPVSFVLLHNIENISKQIETHYPSGIYTFSFFGKEITLKYQKTKKEFPDSENEFLLVGCPVANTTVVPNAGIFRMEFPCPVLDDTFIKLQEKYSYLVRSVYNSLWRKK